MCEARLYCASLNKLNPFCVVVALTTARRPENERLVTGVFTSPRTNQSDHKTKQGRFPMKAHKPVQSQSMRAYYWRSLLNNRALRFVTILVLMVSAASVAITALTFAQKKEKVLRAESKATPATRVAPPRRAAPSQKELRERRLRDGDKGQQLEAHSQEQRGERDRGERKPRAPHTPVRGSFVPAPCSGR